MLAYGKNVLFDMDPNLIKRVYISDGLHDKRVIDYLHCNNIRYDVLASSVIRKRCKNAQGILILCDDYEYCSLDDLYSLSFVLVLDHIEDPHNFGAIIRTCASLGVKGIVIPKDRSVSVTDTVIKSSAGTISHVKIARVVNLVDCLNKLKSNGFFVYGSMLSGHDYRSVDYALKKVLVVGNEGHGLSSLVARNCDELVTIPMKGAINSLNVSVATALLMYEMEE